MTIDDVIARMKCYAKPEDIEFIKTVYAFAEKAHEGQFRISGEPYITHPLEIAGILVALEADAPTLAAAILHDVVEDTEVGLDTIKNNFGEDVATMVDGLTKLAKIEYKSKEEQQAENMRKMFLAMGRDVRVILIKLADRLHNMRTLKSLPPEKQKEIATETLEIFAPIANRLGIYQFKWELEDLSLRYIDPDMYKYLTEKVSKKRDEREEYIQQAIGEIQAKLEEVSIKANIEGRAKHFFGIYSKLTKKGKSFEEIYDLIGIRVLVDTIKDCYGALGIIHTIWRPLPGRFKDYIAMPKPNMYQSLHTTVIGPQGEPLEIQIRTYEMHKIAEKGIAAHWKYKEGGKVDKELEKKLRWLNEMVALDDESRDAKEFMEGVKLDFFSDEVFVFTPKGSVIDLPNGSVPLDLAYRIHTDIGHRCIGAKVNGKIVPLDYRLTNGDIVEILTSKTINGPSRDWLKIVKTSQAKNKIRQWFKRHNREENIIRGKEMLERELRKNGIDFNSSEKQDILATIVGKLKLGNTDELYASIGHGAIAAQGIVNRWLEEARRRAPKLSVDTFTKTGKPEKAGKASKGIVVQGLGDVMVRFAKCCNPLPGDDIVGYVTKGRGVSIHRLDCPNAMLKDSEESVRMVDVAWLVEKNSVYKVRIELEAENRPGVLAEVISAITESKINISEIEAKPVKAGNSHINLVIEVTNTEQADKMLAKLRKLKNVITADRAIAR